MNFTKMNRKQRGEVTRAANRLSKKIMKCWDEDAWDNKIASQDYMAHEAPMQFVEDLFEVEVNVEILFYKRGEVGVSVWIMLSDGNVCQVDYAPELAGTANSGEGFAEKARKVFYGAIPYLFAKNDFQVQMERAAIAGSTQQASNYFSAGSALMGRPRI